MSALDRAFMKAFADAPVRPKSSSGEDRQRPGSPPAPHLPIAPTSSSVPIGSGPKLDHSVGEIALDALVIDRPATAPLSVFSTSAPPDMKEPSGIEVDELAWPEESCELLDCAGRAWDRFVDRLTEKMAVGEACIAFASCGAGAGRTTITLSAAKHLAARGLRIAVIDADFESPNLAQSCRITAQSGWTDVVSGARQLSETLITAVDCGVTVVPCRGRGQDVAPLDDRVRLAAAFESMRERFDLLLLDTARLADQAAAFALADLAEAIRLDAVYLIRDARRTSEARLPDACAALRAGGVRLGGLIENFVDPANLGDSLVQLKMPETARRWLARNR